MTVLTASDDDRLVGDQARELRALVTRRSARGEHSPSNGSRRCRSLAVLSGKGGVGKSVLALNVAIALAHRGDSVCLWDASPGLGNLSLLCGQNGYWNLAHVFAGSRTLNEIILQGPCGIQLVPGASHLLESTAYDARIARSLDELESRFDWLVVDTGNSASQVSRQFARSADCALLVTTPEPTAVAETYAAIKMLAANDGCLLSLVVNQSDSELQAGQVLDRLHQATRTFLRCDVGLAGFIPRDAAVVRSVAARQSLMAVRPGGSAQLAFERLAERLRRTVAAPRESGFSERLRASRDQALAPGAIRENLKQSGIDR
jgi:flagellar biosynthesis protein FlhG